MAAIRRSPGVRGDTLGLPRLPEARARNRDEPRSHAVGHPLEVGSRRKIILRAKIEGWLKKTKDETEQV